MNRDPQFPRWWPGPASWVALWFWVSGLGMAAPPARLGLEQAAQHWAFQPVRLSPPPKPLAGDQVRNPVDAFLLAGLEKQKLTFAPEADRHTWLRRVTLDLTGLPPSYAEQEAFAADRAADAFERVVDRLLASPRYGERWGRHWLDVARYADTKDLVLLYGRDALRPYAYTYRDYVIRAFNEDLPHAEFVEDQLAADLVRPARAPWRLAGLGFLTLGRLFDLNPHDQIDDQIDTTTRGFLGLTVACARCHDHKYDPVGQDDYYALYGIFSANEQPYQLPLIEDPATVPGGAEFEAQLAKQRDELERHIDAEYRRQTESFHRRLPEYLTRAATTRPDLWETTQFALSLTPEDFRPPLMRRTRQLLAERVTATDRIFGPWARLWALPEANFATLAPGVVTALGPEFNSVIRAALAHTTPTNRAGVPTVYGRLLYQLVAEGREDGSTNLPVRPPAVLSADIMTGSSPSDLAEVRQLLATPGSPLSFPRRETPEHMSRPDKGKYHGLVLGLDKLAAHASNRPPARAMVMTELPDPPRPHIFLRGSPARPGGEVLRAAPRVLTGGVPVPFRTGSGRLDLARSISSPTNPLTARVWMNRVWMHHFGEPLVTSPADFGARSEAPVQGALLDWLASEFQRHGGRLKPLHRILVLSAAYRQGNGNPAARALDPENRLLGWYPRRRLELEIMRDTLLAASGRLDLALGGRPVDAPADPSNQRRTVYSVVDRQNLPGLFRAFDFAAPDQCVERRPQTLVPQQALFALNSPFVLEQARALAAACEWPATDRPARIRRLFERALGRAPTAPELAAAERFLETAPASPPSPAAPPLSPSALPQADVWAQLAQVLLVGNEAVFVD